MQEANVGIGTGITAPTEKFEVDHNDGLNLSGGMSLKNLSGTNYNNEIRFYRNSAPSLLWAMGNDVNHNGSNNFFIYDELATSNNTRFLIDGNGKIGIGTASPSAQLHVVGDARITSLGGQTDALVKADINGNLSTVSTSGLGLGLWTTNGANIYNTNTGRVGIGTNAPGFALEIKHNQDHGGIILNRDNSSIMKSQILFEQQGNSKWALGTDQDNIGTDNFFIWSASSSTARLYIDAAGRVGIGMVPPTSWTTSVNYKLYVADGIATRDVKVQANGWPDYVFEKDHNLMSIYELDNYIKQNKHLPDVKTADEIKKDDGFTVSEMQTILLKKIEEQTLYIISLQKQMDELKAKIK